MADKSLIREKNRALVKRVRPGIPPASGRDAPKYKKKNAMFRPTMEEFKGKIRWCREREQRVFLIQCEECPTKEFCDTEEA